MRLLVIGGTVFVGRHFVEAALSRGHEVTIFHRGSKGKGLIPGVEEILGDRDGQLGQLSGRTWDAVVDCCGYVPRVVRQSVEALSGAVQRYLFVSTISVYDLDGIERPDEESPLATLADPNAEEVTGETYGGLKALCEKEVTDEFRDRATIVRPGLIIGPYDPTNRFTYWVDRLARGGQAIVPARPEQPMQLIDARDLGLFMVLLLEKQLAGAFNACGPGEPATFGEMIDSCHRLNLGTELVWVEPDVLDARGVQLWQELPLVLPPDGSQDAMQRVSNERAIAAGLSFRDWSDSAADTHEWSVNCSEDQPKRFGLDPDKEARVLAEIRSEHGNLDPS